MRLLRAQENCSWTFQLSSTGIILHQLALEWKSLQCVQLSKPHEQIWLSTHHWLSCWKLCSKALRSGWELMKRYSRPFHKWPSQKSNPRPSLQNWSSSLLFPLRTSCKLSVGQLLLWLEARWHWCICRHLPGTTSLPSELSFKARPSYVCLTGYTMTPPSARRWPDTSLKM